MPDLLANEQTWPTEEDFNSAPAAQEEDSGAAKPRVKRVPKGTSAYQAAWIVDDDDGDDDDDDEIASGSEMGVEEGSDRESLSCELRVIVPN